MLRLDGIRHGFGAGDVLGGVDVTVHPGEIVCLIGASGCGKSTLLRVAAGLLRPDAGTVTNRFGSHAPVFQEPRLLPWRRVLDNVHLGGDAGTARRLLVDLGLEDYLDAYPAQLSGGMQQRVAIARAFARDTPLLLLDEPFGALDPTRRGSLQRELRHRCIEQNRAALFVTHDLPEAVRLGDRIAVLGSSPARIVDEVHCTAAGGDDAAAFTGAADLLRRPAVHAAFTLANEEASP
ncbi:ATP-binding cassette domain-containing protein [Aquisalimonas lutea]|uniref:ABC transporter ATP-binding protein n=1 Tax=Aquisalimonas lutea TaxID=1327750 RepID=UPI0025B4A254|nr:ATP-binding cassette domain-containing protein [Aquisalimonas lutea]MDN3519465.1 ATP-binding cassette domain-containing protein [Aquisalimonas lutea]